jgi:hypothetical protein
MLEHFLKLLVHFFNLTVIKYAIGKIENII